MAVAKAQTSRRQFVIGASIAAAGAGVLASAGKAMASEPEASGAIVTPGGSCIVDASDMTWDQETEVLVVGYGGAGSAAAIAAKEAGADVLILEANSVGGGCTAYCGQAIAAGGTDVQKELGIEDSPEDFTEYLLAVCDGDEELIREYGMNSLDAYEWMEGLGMTCPAVIGSPGVTFGGNHLVQPEIPRTHWTSSGVWPVLLENVENSDIEVLEDTRVTALISDASTGEIVGVMSGDKAFKAKKAVILAAGGFGNNPDMMHENITTGIYVSFARDTDNGDGMKLAESVGATIGYTAGGNDAPAYSDPEGACTFLIESAPVEGDPAFIAVNNQAKRFMNEIDFNVPVNQAIMAQPYGVCYVITCGEDGVAGFALSSGENIGESPDTMVEADSIDELAEGLGLDPETLTATIDEWNASCAEGEDAAFGRTSILKPIDEPPYAAMAVYPGFSGSLSAVVTNANMEVQAALTGKSIDRLYAVGVNGDMVGRVYACCGSAIGVCIVSGRTAGTNAAALDPWE